MSGSTPDIRYIVEKTALYLHLPFASDSIPGSYAESIIADHYGGEKLAKYDFADVISREMRIGWQVKSTKASTPVTWKRAKIEGSDELIRKSDQGDESATKQLGDLVIEACNDHARESLEKYQLSEIRYARIILDDGRLIYFEKKLIDDSQRILFDPATFNWRWSQPKETKKKEQLPALHGFCGKDKWFSWHGRGENQLHFTGERLWWPDNDVELEYSAIEIQDHKVSWDELFSWLREQLPKSPT